MSLKPETRDMLKTVSTATLCTALFKRGLRNQFIQDVHPLNPAGGPMVGEAFTLRYIPAREDLNPLSVFQDRAHPQRKAVEDCPPGAVMVIDSRKDARAASAGSILVSRLMKRGVAGVVTDGGFRDSPEIAQLAIPAYHHRPSAPTNLTLHQALDINVPIGCGDVAVFPGDVMVGDKEGVVVIPAEIADEIARAPIDITYGGWGQDGHIAYNQARRHPFSSLSLDDLRNCSVRVQDNNLDTIIALAQRTFGCAYQFVPPMSVTLGLKECLSAKKVRLFSDTGAWKQTALRVALFSEPTPEYPMTLLQEHPDALVTATLETATHPVSIHPEWDLGL